MAVPSAAPDVDPCAQVRSRPRGAGLDLLAVAIAAVLVAAAVAVAAYLTRPGSGIVLWVPAAPLFGRWEPRFGLAVVFAALLPHRSHRWWLAVQAAGAVAVSLLVFTPW